MTTTHRNPYATFLTTSDVSTWQICLDEVVSLIDDLPPGVSRLQMLTQALTIALYIIWLSHNSGETTVADYSQEQYEKLVRRLADLPRKPGDPESDTCWGLVLGGSGYRVLGLDLLARHGQPALEHRLFCLPDDDLKTVAALSENFAPMHRQWFLPAVHIYGSALVNVGAVVQAQSLIAKSGWPETEPLLIAVLGSAAERAGNWTEAHARYQVSSWPEHRYRAALTGVIAGAGPQQLTLDQPLLDAMGILDNELNQTALIRSAAFLDACLWQPTSNWLVELEQGKLCFRRRWHSEADTHFATALAAAPEQARYPVASLRFSNLTWLSGDDIVSLPNLDPEARTAGREALALAPHGDDKGAQSTWLAKQANDPTLIPACFERWPAPQCAGAWEALGNEPRAVDAHLTSLEQDYDHRTVMALIRRLAPAEFSEATAYLAELVLRESEDDFFSLWETANELQARSSLLSVDGLLDRAEDGVDVRFRARLRDLSLLEFKNAVRSVRLFRRAGLHDIEEDLLVRAAHSAESVSELLTVAMLCRPHGARAGQLSQLGYRCLMRASRESRDRFEKLQIAHEFFAYGQIASGREILEDERVMDTDTVLSHAEAVAVLQCSAWLPPDRVQDVAGAAIRRLSHDGRSGILEADYTFYADRLRDTLSTQGIRLVSPIPDLSTASPSDDADEGGVDTWSATVAAVTKWLEKDERNTADVVPVNLDPSSTRGDRLVLTIHLLGLMSDAKAAARAAQPEAPPEAMPVRLDLSGDGVRTVELGDLWRLRLTGTRAEQQRAENWLRAFYAKEEELDAQWEAELRQAARHDNRKIVRVCDLLRKSLNILVGPEELSCPHPVLRGLYDALSRDVEQLQQELAETAQIAEHDLSAIRHRPHRSETSA